MNALTPRAAAAVILLGACTGTDGGVSVVHVELEAAPASRGVLRVESEQPLALGFAVAAGGDTLLVADRTTNDVWLVDAASPELSMRRLLDGADRLRARLVAISRVGSEWHLLDRSGTVHRFAAEDWSYRGSAPLSHGGGTVVSAVAASGGGFAMVVRRRRQDAAAAEHVFAFAAADGSVTEAWRMPAVAGAGNGREADVVSLAPTPDGWVMAGTSPPRLIRFDPGGRWTGEESIRRTPARPVGREVVEQFEQMAAAAGARGTLQAPRFYPAVTALAEAGEALLAVPYTGGATGEAQGLDVYCNLEYSRTLLESPAISQVVLAGSAIIVILEQPDFSYEVLVYRTRDLPLDCAGGGE